MNEIKVDFVVMLHLFLATYSHFSILIFLVVHILGLQSSH